MNSLTAEDKVQALELAQSVIDRWEASRLTRVPLLYIEELPQVAGVYFAVTDVGDILYIGKAENLHQRCKISQHHKLPEAIEKNATVLYVAAVGDGLAWAVEQKLIAHFAPPLNAGFSRWWESHEMSDAEKESIAGLKMTTAVLRAELVKVRKRARKGEIIPVYKYGELQGVLAPARWLNSLNCVTAEVSMTDFRARLSTYCDEFTSRRPKFDACVIKDHDRVAMVFFHPKFEEVLKND